MALKFKEMSDFKNGYAVVKNFDDTYQFLDKSGNFIPGKFYHIDKNAFSDGYGLVETTKNNFNFVDKDGNLLLEKDLPINQKPSPFINGYSIIELSATNQKSLYTYIDKKGKKVGSENFTKANEFINGYAEIVTQDNQVGYISEKGKVYSDPTWEKFHPFSDGFALIKDNKGKYYFINPDKKRVSKKFTFAQEYSEGLAVIGELRKNYHYMNTSRKELKGSFSNASKFSEGYALVSSNDDSSKYYLIDKNCNRVNDAYFTGTIRDVKDGMILERTTSNSGYTFYNLKGKKLNNEPFDYAEDFAFGYASVKTNNNGWTCIDKFGNFVPFTSPTHFKFTEEGLAKVVVNKTDLDGNEVTKYKFINPSGKYVTEEFDFASDFSEGYAVVCKGNTFFAIDKHGNYLGNEIQSKSQTKQKDVYGFTYMNLTNDELLYEYVDADLPVFLHGVSGVGKSTRVSSLDKDPTHITLRPGMNHEEVDGTLNYETDEYIPPLWYQQITEKCEKEPDRKHLVFIDELTNVKPTVQSLVYSIVLNRTGKDGLWPLPDNSVVIAAGNENKNNIVTHPLTNALWRRFCHIYYDVDKIDWINWATTKNQKRDIKCVKANNEKPSNKIHPTIISYIMAKKEKVLNQDLDENNPTIVTDPRKWEIASKVLNNSKNPYTLVPAIGKDLTDDFVSFIKLVNDNLVETVEKNGAEDLREKLLDLSLSRSNSEETYSQNSKAKENDEAYSAIAQLSLVSEEKFEETHQVVKDVFGKEISDIFEAIWINNARPEETINLNENDENYIGNRLNNNQNYDSLDNVEIINNADNLENNYDDVSEM